MVAVWLAAGHQGGSGSVAGRIALVTVAVLAVGAFAVLQGQGAVAPRRPPRRRRYDPSDWRTLPAAVWPEGRDDEAPSGNEERYRPGLADTGTRPGTSRTPCTIPARSPWAVREDAARDLRSLPPGMGSGARVPAAFPEPGECVFRVFVSVTGQRVDWQRLDMLAARRGGAS